MKRIRFTGSAHAVNYVPRGDSKYTGGECPVCGKSRTHWEEYPYPASDDWDWESCAGVLAAGSECEDCKATWDDVLVLLGHRITKLRGGIREGRDRGQFCVEPA
jgi:hypothetical protein